MMTIRQAYEQALQAAERKGVAESQREMVAALAVGDAMNRTLENMIALREIMREINAKRFA